MRIFITGGSGFIGKHLMEKLDYTDACNYDLENGNDIRDLAALDRAIDNFKPDAIVHLAALAGVRRGESYPAEYFSTNVTGTYNVLAMAQKHGIKKVVIFSSSCVFNEEGELKPYTVYGQSKLAVEHLAEWFSSIIPNVYVIRPFTVYGKHGRGDQLFMTWKRQAEDGKPLTFFGDGESFRPYTHVEDVCDAVYSLLMNAKGYQVFNLCGAFKFKLKEVYDIFARYYSKKGITISREVVPMPATDSMGREPRAIDRMNWSMIPYEPRKDFEESVVEILEHDENDFDEF